MSERYDATDDTSRPWYRHFWVWFLMVPPLAAVVFWSVILATTAASPSLVVDDYARIGMAYEEERARDRAAATRGVEARLHLNRAEGSVTIALTGLDDPPDALALRLAHPTEAARDARARLRRIGSGIYRGPVQGPSDGRRYVQLEPVAGDWRLGGELFAGDTELTLTPPAALAEQ